MNQRNTSQQSYHFCRPRSQQRRPLYTTLTVTVLAALTASLFRHSWEGWIYFFPFLVLFSLLSGLDAIRVRREGLFIDDEGLRIRINADQVTMRWHDIVCLQENDKALTLIDTARGYTFSPNSFEQSERLRSLIRTRVPQDAQAQDAWKRVPWFQEVLALSEQIVQGEAPAVSYHQPRFWLSLLALMIIILVAILNNAWGLTAVLCVFVPLIGVLASQSLARVEMGAEQVSVSLLPHRGRPHYDQLLANVRPVSIHALHTEGDGASIPPKR